MNESNLLKNSKKIRSAKLVCPNCGYKVKKCHFCNKKFSASNEIICVELKGRHFCNRHCYTNWLFERCIKKFEKEHFVTKTWVLKLDRKKKAYLYENKK